METINLPNGTKLFTDFREQVGKLGRPFSLSGISKDMRKPPIWRKVNGFNKEFYYWIYSFRYIDDRSKGFDIMVNQNDIYDGKIDIV